MAMIPGIGLLGLGFGFAPGIGLGGPGLGLHSVKSNKNLAKKLAKNGSASRFSHITTLIAVN